MWMCIGLGPGDAVRLDKKRIGRAARRHPLLGPIKDRGERVIFNCLERVGLHLTPVDFQSPLPNTRELKEPIWHAESEMVGIDLRQREQMALLKMLGAWKSEFEGLLDWPSTSSQDIFYLQNGFFGPVDSEILYAMIRKLRPRRVIEVGSGYSTLVMLKALALNRLDGSTCNLTCYDPYPRDFIVHRARQGLLELCARRVQDVSVSVFQELNVGDLLFIDSSHVLKLGSDVQFEYLEILPRLQAGVLVHIHDVFLPANYPPDLVLDRHLFWNEQYLLQAFLSFNYEYEIVLGANYIHRRHPEILRSLFASYGRGSPVPTSFWIGRL